MIEREVRPVGEIAAQSSAARRVFERLGIDYCCRGERPLDAACAAAGITAREAIAAIEAEERQSTAREVERDWTGASLRELILHIMDTHHAFVRAELGRLSLLIDKVAGVHEERHPELINVQAVWDQLRAELVPHMMKEEQILFPFVAMMEEAAASGRPAPLPPFASVENPIRAMVAEHEAAGELLKELRLITRGYAVPSDGCASYVAMLEGLQEFERDLHLHIHLENNVLFPRAIRLEEEALAGMRYESCRS